MSIEEFDCDNKAASVVNVPKKRWDDEEDSDGSVPDDWDVSDSEDSEGNKAAQTSGEKTSIPAPKPKKKKTLSERIAERQTQREAEKAAKGGAEADLDSVFDEDPRQKVLRERQAQREADAKTAEDLFAGLTVQDTKTKDALADLQPKTAAEFDEFKVALVDRIQKYQTSRNYLEFLDNLVRDLARPLKDLDVRKISSTLNTLANEKQRNSKESKKKGKNKKASVVTSTPKNKTDTHDYSQDYNDFDDFM